MTLTVQAYAKLNLTLEVINRRMDGFHQIASVMQSVSLSDELTFEPAERIILTCTVPELQNDSNLVVKAANLLHQLVGGPGVHIHLNKRIPVSSGLGGGSADAAATLWALNKFWEVNTSLLELQRLSTLIGTDISFCLLGGTALAEGKGNQLTPLPPPKAARWFVIVRPPVEIPEKTATLYHMINQSDWTDGSASLKLAQAMSSGAPLNNTLFQNGFDFTAAGAFPAIEEWRKRLNRAGALNCYLTGTGPALFAPVPGEGDGWEIVDKLGPDAVAFVVHTVPHGVEEVEAES